MIVIQSTLKHFGKRIWERHWNCLPLPKIHRQDTYYTRKLLLRSAALKRYKENKKTQLHQRPGKFWKQGENHVKLLGLDNPKQAFEKMTNIWRRLCWHIRRNWEIKQRILPCRSHTMTFWLYVHLQWFNKRWKRTSKTMNIQRTWN